jgi:hypothetical protein
LLADFVAGLAAFLATTFLATTFVDLALVIGFDFFATGFTGAFALLTGFALFLVADTLGAGFFIVVFAMDRSYKLVITYI